MFDYNRFHFHDIGERKYYRRLFNNALKREPVIVTCAKYYKDKKLAMIPFDDFACMVDKCNSKERTVTNMAQEIQEAKTKIAYFRAQSFVLVGIIIILAAFLVDS